MKKLYKISFCVVSVFVIVFSMFPLTAFAITNPVYTSVSYNRPELTGNDFYVELLLYNSSTNVYHTKVVYFNSVPVSSYTPDVTYLPSYGLVIRDTGITINCSYDGNMSFNYFGVEIYDNNRVPWIFSGSHTSGDFSIGRGHSEYGVGFRCVNFYVYGNVVSVTSELSTVTSDVKTEFIVEYGEAASIHNSILSLYQLISRLGSMNAQYYEQSIEYFQSLDKIVNDIYSQGEVTQGHIKDLLSVIKIISADIILIRNDLDKIYQELLEQGQVIDDIYDQVYLTNILINDLIAITSEIRDYSAWIWESTLYISGVLDNIYNILNSGSDKEQPTKQDPTQFDNYYDVENSLIGNPDDVSDVVKVELNNNAMSVIWKIVEDFLNSHGKVMGFVLTILSFGLIALILGR